MPNINNLKGVKILFLVSEALVQRCSNAEQFTSWHPGNRKYLCSWGLSLPPFIPAMPPACRMVLPTVRVGFSSLVNPLWKCPHRYTQRALLISEGPFNPITLTIKIKHPA
jgi:hypothetical protein